MNLLITNNTNENINMRDDLEKVIKEVLITEDLSLDYEISITFVDNDEIHRLNNEYRGVDKVTDVLSFPMDMGFEIDGIDTMLGDIVIAMDIAADQAEEYGHSLEREVMYLTAHSMLHLLGYDHMTDDDKKKMRDREKEIMSNLGVFK